MKLIHILLLFASLASIAFAWTKDDYELFDLVSELEAAEGKGIDFYSHIGVSPSATTGEINKAYRKKSLALHPDKNPGVKDIQARFARLGVISQILRSPERRERYNFFYKNGVPKWRGTGYYYSRYRPTLAHTLIFLIFLTSLFHLLVLFLNYNKDKARVAYFARSARATSSASQGKKVRIDEQTTGRRVRVSMVEGNDYAGQLELVVIGEDVYLPHDEDGSLTPLDGLATRPSFFRTWPFRLAQSLFYRAVKLLPPSIESKIPAFVLPVAPFEGELAETDAEVEGFDVTPTPSSRKNRRDRKSASASATPRDSPATTEIESDEGDETIVTDEKKKKKRGPGKASGMHRRKMALKK